MDRLNFRNNLEKKIEKKCILENELMKNHTTFKSGGPADFVIIPQDIEQIAFVINCCKEENAPFFILGNGSNLLVMDVGYKGVVIKLGETINNIEVDNEYVYAQAGATLFDISNKALEFSLTGFEFASGIPGTLGGAIYMNAGAYNGEIKDVIVSVDVLDKNNEVKTLLKDELNLGYRTSIFMDSDYIIIGAKLKLQQGDHEKIKNRIDNLTRRRTESQPLEWPSAGSTFKRPDVEGYFAAKLIEDAGLKGYSVGDAEVSQKHSGFLINKGNATTKDILKLIEDVKQVIYKQYGIMLEPEVKMLG